MQNQRTKSSWLGKKFQRFLDVSKEIAGFYKTSGALDKEDDRDFLASFYLGSPGLKDKDLPDRVDLFNSYTYDQGRTNHCTAYAVSMALTIQKVREGKDFGFYFNPEELWDKQMEYPGTGSESGGDYIASAIKALKHFGLEDRGKIHHISKYLYVPRNEFKYRLYEGYPIVCGFSVRRPLIDYLFFWRLISKGAGGGHAFVIVGYDNKLKAFICQNSWGKWGEDGIGRFYIKYEDVGQLFRGWIMDIEKSGENKKS